jgi:hypothetical protein
MFTTTILPYLIILFVIFVILYYSDNAVNLSLPSWETFVVNVLTVNIACSVILINYLYNPFDIDLSPIKKSILLSWNSVDFSEFLVELLNIRLLFLSSVLLSNLSLLLIQEFEADSYSLFFLMLVGISFCLFVTLILYTIPEIIMLWGYITSLQKDGNVLVF